MPNTPTKTPPQAVKSAVNAYLMARTHAEVLRARVDQIERHILETAPYYSDPKLTRKPKERITEPKYSYLLEDSEAIDYYMAVKTALVEAGFEIKLAPGEPEHHYFCPACVAESLQRDTEHLLIECAAEWLDEEEPEKFAGRLLCRGLADLHRFIDLVVGCVVAHPDYRNPLTGKKVNTAA